MGTKCNRDAGYEYTFIHIIILQFLHHYAPWCITMQNNEMSLNLQITIFKFPLTLQQSFAYNNCISYRSRSHDFMPIHYLRKRCVFLHNCAYTFVSCGHQKWLFCQLRNIWLIFAEKGYIPPIYLSISNRFSCPKRKSVCGDVLYGRQGFTHSFWGSRPSLRGKSVSSTYADVNLSNLRREWKHIITIRVCYWNSLSAHPPFCISGENEQPEESQAHFHLPCTGSNNSVFL